MVLYVKERGKQRERQWWKTDSKETRHEETRHGERDKKREEKQYLTCMFVCVVDN